MLFKYLIPILLLFVAPSWADWSAEKEKINFLIEGVGRVDGVFIRNGKEYSPEQAAGHLKMKMENAMNSWFSPDKDKWTAEMFIDKIATKSSISGDSYKIEFKGGNIVNASDWLREQLKIYEKIQKRITKGGITDE